MQDTLRHTFDSLPNTTMQPMQSSASYASSAAPGSSHQHVIERIQLLRPMQGDDTGSKNTIARGRDPWRALQGLDRIKGFLNALRQDSYH